MTTVTFVNTISINSYGLHDFEQLIVTPTGQINAPFTLAIYNDRSASLTSGAHNITIEVMGSVSCGSGIAIDLSRGPFPSPGPANAILVTASGLVTSGMNFVTVFMGGAGNAFSNAGTVIGGGGFWGTGMNGGHIDNSGTITGAFGAALHLDSFSSTTITNSGALRGVAGVEFINSTARVFNAGDIVATDETRAAFDGASASAAFVLRNSGTVSGPVKGLIGSAFADVITNKGSIEGTIDLGSGADKFFGRLGTIDSKISGGNDRDFIQSGRGDDVVDGGSGNDTLSGNAGDDTLTGGSFADTFVFLRRGGDDVVTDFVSGTDKIDLRAFHFVNFAAVSSLLVAHPGGVELDLTSKLGGTVEFSGLTLASLTSGDFLI